MRGYKVNLAASVYKDLRDVPRQMLGRLMGVIDSLKQDPVPMNAIAVSPAEKIFRIRVGDCRIVYSVDHEGKTVTIQAVQHR
ncbi:MAG: type II toxin-antitoxin system RelE/ParE family toxin [Planctomycetota bacterium]|nr:type II toxin-antitoxin system RelE/ParE family toxin [Planctomycetota bacterium]